MRSSVSVCSVVCVYSFVCVLVFCVSAGVRVYCLCVSLCSLCLSVCIETGGTKRLRISMRSSASQSYIDLCVCVCFFACETIL
jgi:hypothetical protein